MKRKQRHTETYMVCAQADNYSKIPALIDPLKTRKEKIMKKASIGPGANNAGTAIPKTCSRKAE